MSCAVPAGMIAKTVEDLQVYQRARELSLAVAAILERAGFRQDRELRDQIRDAAGSVVSNVAEGFPQPTDRGFAGYLYHARASSAEVRARLQVARDRNYISDAELTRCDQLADEVAAMSTGLIKYLLRANRRNRALGLTRR